MSNYMLHFALLLHVCSLPQALSLLLRMSQKVGSCRLHWLTVCLNTTALALVSKVTTDCNVCRCLPVCLICLFACLLVCLLVVVFLCVGWCACVHAGGRAGGHACVRAGGLAGGCAWERCMRALHACVCACVRCMRACVPACVCVCDVRGWTHQCIQMLSCHFDKFCG